MSGGGGKDDDLSVIKNDLSYSHKTTKAFPFFSCRHVRKITLVL